MRVAPDLGARDVRRQGAGGETDGIVDPVGCQSDLRLEDRGAGFQVGARDRACICGACVWAEQLGCIFETLCGEQLACSFEMLCGEGPAGRGHRGMSQPEVDVGGFGPAVHPADGRSTDCDGVVYASRQGKCLDEERCCLGLSKFVCPSESVDCRGQGPSGYRRPARHDQQLAGPLVVARLKGEIGCQVPPLAVGSRMSSVERLQGGRGQRLPPWGKKPFKDRVAGQSVPEGERLALDGQQLMLHSTFECTGHHLGGLIDGVGDEVPIELAAEDRRGREHDAFVIREVRHPRPDGLGERSRHSRRSQQFLDEERDPVRGALNAPDRLVVRTGHTNAHHLGDESRVQPGER